MILPPARIGIIGAGQLAMYMCIEAIKMGYQVATYDPNPNSPAKRVSDFTCGSFDDLKALDLFASKCDLITYEFENMNLEHIEFLDKKYNLPQGSKILKHTAHRYEEIQMADKLGIPVVPSIYLENDDVDKSGLNTLSLPLIIKTVRFGYDGKGQSKAYTYEDVKIETESLVSELIDFDYEISIILVRSKHEIQTYPVFKNTHKNGVLHYTSTVCDEQFSKGVSYASLIAQEMNYIGVMAVEFFVKDGELIFNEVAPRPHNSGHLTLSVSNKSQFKVHIEAICNLPIGKLEHYEDALMVNLLGDELIESRNNMNQIDVEHFEYGKPELKEGRKMGHDIYTKEAMIVKMRELNRE